jgi:hypothetical protein
MTAAWALLNHPAAGSLTLPTTADVVCTALMCMLMAPGQKGRGTLGSGSGANGTTSADRAAVRSLHAREINGRCICEGGKKEGEQGRGQNEGRGEENGIINSGSGRNGGKQRQCEQQQDQRW